MQDKILRNFLIVLYVMYFSQGILYPSGLISQTIVIIIVAICLFYFIKCLLLNKVSTVFKLWTIIFFFNIIYSIFTADYENVLHFENIKGTILTSLSFYPFYFMSKRGIELKRSFTIFFLLSIPIALIQFIILRDNIILDSLRVISNHEVVNNTTYFMAMLIPFGFFMKNKALAGSLMLLLFYFIVLGVKRETTLAGGLSIFAFAYINYKESRGILKNLLIIVVSLVLITIAFDFVLNNDFLIERFQSTINTRDSSGRDELANNILKYWYNNGNIGNLLFGYGFASTLEASKENSFAHNDWVEMLCNYGLVAVSIYLLLFLNLFRLAFKTKQGLILLLIILLALIRTMFSMFYTSIESFVLVMILAAFAGKKIDEDFK